MQRILRRPTCQASEVDASLFQCLPNIQLRCEIVGRQGLLKVDNVTPVVYSAVADDGNGEYSVLVLLLDQRQDFHLVRFCRHVENIVPRLNENIIDGRCSNALTINYNVHSHVAECKRVLRGIRKKHLSMQVVTGFIRSERDCKA